MTRSVVNPNAKVVCRSCAKLSGWIEKPSWWREPGVIAHCLGACGNEPTLCFPRTNWVEPKTEGHNQDCGK